MRCLSSCLMSAGLGVCLVASAAAQVPFSEQDWPQWRGPNRDGISLDKGLL